MAEEKYNMKNPAVKRIMQEVKEMQNNLSDDYMSLPLEDNIFEWQFAIRGPRDTEFEGGIYHGRIQLPSEYPLKPPAFMLLTPNGRFETQTKICLSISNYHPEHWQPSWSVRSALVALIAFMPTKPEGAVGSLDYPKEERIALAVKSRAYPPKFGNEDRQKLINEIHEYMLEKSSPLNQNAPANDNEAKDQPPNSTEECEIHSSTTENLYVREHDGARTTEHVEEVRAGADPMEVMQGSQLHSEQSHQHNNIDRNIQNVRKSSSTRRPKPADDRGFNMIAACLVVAIVALLLKRFLKAYWWINV